MLDLDRAEWGDPLADWAVWTARRKPGREGFWGGYGTLPDDEGARVRLALYSARHRAVVRLEHARLGERDGVSTGDGALEGELAALLAA